MPISLADLPNIKKLLSNIVEESLNHFSELVISKDIFYHEESKITDSFNLAFYEFCDAELNNKIPMESTIENITSRINNALAEDFKTAGLYGHQLETKISLINVNKFINPKRWLECLKSLMMSILSITGGDEALKELMDMGINIITDQADS